MTEDVGSPRSAAEDVVTVTVVVPRARLAELYTMLGEWFGPEQSAAERFVR
ncbi:MAG TPA: hypothetical protein VG452_05990 [Egibacteraceae bacterium]|nr:hypothetical protein [Actinomycetota bacterium]HWB71750.1 hypothetical protein [Egibacteraceae bacterium]